MTFIDDLHEACKQQSQRAVADMMGYSPATISLVLKGRYTGDLTAVEKAFKGAFQDACVICPVLGEIPAHRCLTIQRQPFAATNHQRVLLFKACKKCPHRKGQDTEKSDFPVRIIPFSGKCAPTDGGDDDDTPPAA